MTPSEIAAQAVMNTNIRSVCIILLAAVAVLYLEYLIRRWSWIPRKKHDRKFIERF